MTDHPGPQRISDARPIEGGFSRLRCPDCCVYSLTLIRQPAKKIFAYYKVRVTALPGTVILAADPDDWYQTANFPASVIWYTGAALPAGDPQDSWIIDNDFTISLGPVSPGIKSIRVEWLGIKDKVLSSQRIDIPCLGSGEDYDFETEWERYTVVEKGREDTFAYLEPDDCDLDVTDTLKTTSCFIAPFAPTCAGGGQYTVVLQETTTGSSGLYKYTWTINTKSGSVVATVIGNNVSVDLPPGSYEVVLDLQDNNGDSVGECSATLDLLAPEPAFTWSQVDCEQEIELDASSTENAHLVSTWEWSCSDPSITIGAGQQSVANFASVGAGSYLVTLKITDIYGCTWEPPAQTVKVVDCEASFTHKYSWCVDRIDPNIKKDVQVTFTNTSVGCPPFTCKWEFGDGDVSVEVDPVHTYKQAAHGQSFQVVLTMTDSKGCSKKVTESIAIQQRVRPDFEVKVCPDGKVICTTNAPNPTWETTGAPKTAPWPYTNKKKGRIIFKFETPGSAARKEV